MSIKKAKRNGTPAQPEQYTHKDDEIALSALKKIPFFDKLCSKFIETFDEPFDNIWDTSSKIEITEKQLPKIYNMTADICKKLGIEIPKLYLELDRIPNAHTYGNKKATISITTGLLECLKDDEIYAILAHECGHIACKHLLYHTMGALLLDGGSILGAILDKNLIASAILTPLKVGFFHWVRCSELSADRAAAICCGNADLVVKTMMRLAGGTTTIKQKVDMQSFIQQTKDYDSLINGSVANKAIEFYLTSKKNITHPLHAIRAYKITEWADSAEFKTILRGMKKEQVDNKSSTRTYPLPFTFLIAAP